MILSIDQSTSSTKGLVWSSSGEMLGRADVKHKQITNSFGWVEHDPIEILKNTYIAAKNALYAAKVTPSQILAIGLSNQRETAVCWHRKTGKPLYNAIVWQCARAIDMVEELRKNGLEEEVRKRTGLTLSPYFSAAKFGWLVKHVPEAAKALQEDNLCCGTIDSWLLFNLTGEFKTDYSNASRTQLFNLQKLEWDTDILQAFGLTQNCLPKVCMSDSYFGSTSFNSLFPQPIPIHGVLGDSHGALFGNQCFKKYSTKVTYGTGSSVMMNVGATIPKPQNGIVASIAWGINNTVEYVLEGNINYCGAIVSWLIEDMQILEDVNSAEKYALMVEDTGGVYLVPAFSGLGAPYFNENAKAAWLGMNRNTKKPHLIRAAQECIAYQVRDILEIMRDCIPSPISSIKADGGPTSNNFIMSFQSGILNMPIEISRVEEMSGMGAAFCAAIGAGIATGSDLFDNKQWQNIQPTMSLQKGEELYKGWKNAVLTINGG